MSDPQKPRGPETSTSTRDGSVTATLPAVDAETLVAPEKPKPIRLEVLAGPMDGLAHTSDAKVVRIGRSRDCDFRLPMDRMVSGRHARLVREGSQFWLQDAGSRNGTFVGDQKITSKILIGPGATFRVGRTVLEILPS